MGGSARSEAALVTNRAEQWVLCPYAGVLRRARRKCVSVAAPAVALMSSEGVENVPSRQRATDGALFKVRRGTS